MKKWWWVVYGVALALAWTIPFNGAFNHTGAIPLTIAITGVVGLIGIYNGSLPAKRR